jgi:hypothetical protein
MGSSNAAVAGADQVKDVTSQRVSTATEPTTATHSEAASLPDRDGDEEPGTMKASALEASTPSVPRLGLMRRDHQCWLKRISSTTRSSK